MPIDSQSDMGPSLVAMLTPPGRGAVAVLSLHGPLNALEESAQQQGLPFFKSRNHKPLSLQKYNRICFGTWRQESLVACRIHDQLTEIYPHGGKQAAARIMEDLVNAGAKEVSWQEHVAAFSHSWDADYQSVLTRCVTERTAELILHQQHIARGFWLRLEAELMPQAECEAALAWSNFGLHLTKPWNVVLAGSANVGKSSLINKLLGYERSIVFDQPGTTRDVITAETAIEGWPIHLSDTAGHRETTDDLEVTGISFAIEKIEQADLALLVIDQSQPMNIETAHLQSQFPDMLPIFHKADLPRHADWQDERFLENSLQVSSLTGAGIEQLLQRIVQKLVPEIPPVTQPIPVSSKQLAHLQQALTEYKISDEADREFHD